MSFYQHGTEGLSCIVVRNSPLVPALFSHPEIGVDYWQSNLSPYETGVSHTFRLRTDGYMYEYKRRQSFRTLEHPLVLRYAKLVDSGGDIMVLSTVWANIVSSSRSGDM